MIARYAQPDMDALWSDQKRFALYLQVEVAFLKAWQTTPPVADATAVRSTLRPQINDAELAALAAAPINPARITEIEQSTQHDFIAFCTSISEQVAPTAAKYFHWAATSSDVMDTALNLQLKASLDLILPACQQVLQDLWHLAEKYSTLLALGRSHGMAAEPIIFGQKFLSHYAEFYRRYQELKAFQEKELRLQYSGAVGSYSLTNLQVEQKAAQILGLLPEEVSSQVIPRDRLAKLIAIDALLASALERLATEIRHLARSEVQEVREGFQKGQKGSSVMPHKKNPVLSENLTGIARLLRSHLNVALENIVLWHERDISHSSTERVYLPDHLSLLLFALRRTHHLLTNLVVHEDQITQHVQQEDRYLSSFYLHYILANSDLSREEVYAAVQQASFERGDLKTSLEQKLSLKLPAQDFATLQAWYAQQFKAIQERCRQAYPLPS